MVCPFFDEENSTCTKLGQKFYTGMQKPCLELDDPKLCQLLIMRGISVD